MFDSPFVNVIAFTLLAGLAMPLGAACAHYEHIQKKWLEQELLHGIVAFGGGALLAAVALVLVPDGIKTISSSIAISAFIAGGLAFMALDIVLVKHNTPASQLAAMLSDFIPEAIALGAAFAYGSSTGFLLALLIGLQNLPEGFNAYRELKAGAGLPARRIIGLFALMSLLGPISGVAGFLVLADFPNLLGAMMLFAGGGILYCVFQDIAPDAKLERHWAPSLGAVLGFALGLLGHMLSHA